MPIGQLITLGVGTPSSIPILDLTGLMTSQISSGGDTTGSPLPGVPTVLSGNVIYALPARLVNIEWYASGAAIIEGSNDQTNWVTLDSLASAGNSTISGAATVFIRPSAQVTVIIRKKKAKL